MLYDIIIITIAVALYAVVIAVECAGYFRNSIRYYVIYDSQDGRTAVRETTLNCIISLCRYDFNLDFQRLKWSDMKRVLLEKTDSAYLRDIIRQGEESSMQSDLVSVLDYSLEGVFHCRILPAGQIPDLRAAALFLIHEIDPGMKILTEADYRRIYLVD